MKLKVSEFLNKRTIFGSIYVSGIESISHSIFDNFMNNHHHIHANKIGDILSNTIHHIPLGIICMLGCNGSLKSYKTWTYMLLGLLMHIVYEGGGDSHDLYNILATATIGELFAYIYNYKKLQSN